MSQTRIYADFNGLVRGPSLGRTAVVLDTYGSLRDLSNAGVILSTGLPLIAFDESDEAEDLEGHGTAQYDLNRGWWVVEFDEQGVRYVPARRQQASAEFHCVKCKAVVPGATYSMVWQPGFSCGVCGASVLMAIEPPQPAI